MTVLEAKCAAAAAIAGPDRCVQQLNGCNFTAIFPVSALQGAPHITVLTDAEEQAQGHERALPTRSYAKVTLGSDVFHVRYPSNLDR